MRGVLRLLPAVVATPLQEAPKFHSPRRGVNNGLCKSQSPPSRISGVGLSLHQGPKYVNIGGFSGQVERVSVIYSNDL